MKPIRIVTPIFLILFSIILLNLGSNDILTYAQENKTNNIVIKDSNLIVEEYISGLNLPVMIDFIDDDDGIHMLVIEKDEGTVKIIKDDILISEPILQLEVSNASEEGLLGILVQNNDVFVHHTTRSVDDDTTSNWFTKYTWDGEKLIEPVELLSFHKGTGTHNGGVMIEDENGIVFGAIGDLGYGKDLDMQQQKNFLSAENNYIGSILSLNAPSEVYAVGIRNTYGLDIDPVTGILWDTENGHRDFDEINLVQKKFNSGWSKIQGPIKDNQETPIINGYEYSDPEFSWERPVAVTSIHFIQSPLFPEYENSVLIGSFGGGILYKFELNENRDGFRFDDNNLKDLVLNKDDSPNEIIFGTGFAGITDIKEGPDGSIYIVTIGDGKISRISPALNGNIGGSDCQNFSDSKNFSGCIFSGEDFIGKNFSNKASLVSAGFQKTILSKVNFEHSDLERSLFDNAELESTKFMHANLMRAGFESSNLTFVDLENTNLVKANFDNAILKNANFNGAKIWKTKLNNADLENSSFVETDVFKSEFRKSNLKNADFQFSKLTNVDFTDADLTSVNLLYVYPVDSIFDDTILKNAKINTCLEHDTFSKILNKILRSIEGLNSEFFEKLIISVC